MMLDVQQSLHVPHEQLMLFAGACLQGLRAPHALAAALTSCVHARCRWDLRRRAPPSMTP